jgi:AcrR family transcriptional regulator
VKITDIARKACVSQVSIYNFFGSKENLKKQLLLRLWETHFQKMMSVFESNETIQNKIEKLFYEVAENSLNFSMNFVREDFRDQLKNSDNLIPTQIKKIENEIRMLLEQGKNEGVIKNAISTDALLYCVEIFRYYFINNSEAAISFNKDHDLLEEIISLYLSALFA